MTRLLWPGPGYCRRSLANSPSDSAATHSKSRELPSHLGAVGLALLVAFLWSSSWILIRWGLDRETLRPLGFAALRYGLASVALLTWVAIRPDFRRSLRLIDRGVAIQILTLGVIFYAVTQGAQFVAIDNQPAATTSLVLSFTPLVVSMLAGRSLDETVSARQVTGAILVLGGAALYFSGQLGATLVGMTAAVVGLAANVSSSLLGRRVNRAAALPAVVITALSMACGALLLVVVALATEHLPSISLRAWLIIGWLALVNTAVAFTLWNLSLRRLTAVESSGINNTMLVQIALLAWVFLGESPGWLGWSGVLLVSMGVFLTQTATGNPRS